MFKPYNTHDEIPGNVKKEICLGNKVFKVTDVPLKDINSFYSIWIICKSYELFHSFYSISNNNKRNLGGSSERF